MARTYIMGFEANDTGTLAPAAKTVDGQVVGTGATFDTATVRSGTYSLKVVAASGAASYLDASGLSFGYIRIYLRVTARPSTTARIFAGSTAGVNLRLNPAGTIVLYNGSTLIGTSTTTLTDTTRWYRVEVRLVDGTSVATLLIDGGTEITASPSGWSFPRTFGANDTVADTYTAYLDDFVVDDAAFPGDGKVVLLLPESDDTRTNWTSGNGGTTNLWDAVNNLPPAGLASASETATTNIESASSTGTATYIAAMSTYSAKGVGAGDTVNAIQQTIIHGEDITTGTKTGTYELTLNPVVSSTNYTAGADAGAHVAYNASASAWAVARLITDAPTISAVTTAPKMKLVKTDTTTRVSCVCFMGIYVDYTPVVAVDPMPLTPHTAFQQPVYRM